MRIDQLQPDAARHLYLTRGGLSSDVYDDVQAARVAAQGTSIGVELESYRLVGPSWSALYGDATDVLVYVGKVPHCVFHKPTTADARTIFRTTLRLNGDEVVNERVLAALGFSSNDARVKDPRTEGVSYVTRNRFPPRRRPITSVRARIGL